MSFLDIFLGLDLLQGLMIELDTVQWTFSSVIIVYFLLLYDFLSEIEQKTEMSEKEGEHSNILINYFPYEVKQVSSVDEGKVIKCMKYLFMFFKKNI